MSRSPVVSRAILLLFLHCLLHGFQNPVLADIPVELCTSNSSYPPNSSYQSNLNELTSWMIKNASSSKYFQGSSGNSPNKVYGQYMCLNYVLDSMCQSCVSRGSEDILKLCPNKMEVVVWEEYCQLRISSQEFFGHLDLRMERQINPIDISDPDKFREVVNKTLSYLGQNLVLDSSATHYATKEQDFELDSNQSLHALVQCTKNLTADDCQKCLQEATRYVIGCCYFSSGARVLNPSCYLRYELYNFYNDSATEPVKKSGKKWPIKVFTISSLCLASISLFFLISFIIIKRKRSLANRHSRSLPTSESAHGMLPCRYAPGNTLTEIQDHPYFDMRCILAATDNFSDTLKLGQGGFGPVYKGILWDGREVAVKRLESWSEKGSEEFRNEVLLIMKLQHKNLVRLLGFCAEREEKLLVYEYMPNRSLDVFLFDAQRRTELSWSRRLNIIIGIAQGMLYLHEDSRQRIIFRDLKASNVLLDCHMNPKISDFGLARIFAVTENEANTATLVGTYGYMAPEYAMEGLYSIKSDVYSFGVVLLEIATGERNAGFWQSGRAPSLVAYAWQLWNEGRATELMDPLLHNKCCPEEFMKCVHIGLLCVQDDALDRPTMSSVNVMLKKDAVILRQPSKPAFSVGRFTNQSNGGVDDDDCSVNGLTVSTVVPR